MDAITIISLLTLGMNSLAYSSGTNFLFEDVTLVSTHSLVKTFGYYDKYFINASYYSYEAMHFDGTDNAMLEDPYAISHTGITKIANSSYYYNCHSFAWLYEGELSLVPSDSSELYSLTDNGVDTLRSSFIYAYNCATSCIEYTSPSTISNTSSISIGDIVMYDNPYDPNQNKFWHSGVVISTSTNINNVLVRSKWSMYGVYEHSILNCPYYSPGGPNNLFNGFPESKIRIYKINHNKTYDRSTATHHFYKTSCCGKTIKSVHTFSLVNNKMVCSTCGYISNISPYSTEDVEI